MTKDNPNPLLTLAEAGDYLGGISTRTVRRLIANGDLHGTYVGRKPLVRCSDLEDYLNTTARCAR